MHTGRRAEEFLEKHRAEARRDEYFEYDQEKHLRQEREAAWEDGHAAAVKETAENLFKLGVPVETIASAVNARVDEVRIWLNENNID